MRERIIELLGHGISHSAVAAAVGCEPSYVTQLVDEEGIAEQITEKKLHRLEQSAEVDSDIDDLEKMALNRMRQLLPFITRPMDAARVFQTLNSAKKKTPEIVTGDRPTAPVVQLNIPVNVAVQFKLSSDQQVVEVDGRSMSTLPSSALNTKLRERKESRPAITDATTAAQLITGIERGIPAQSLVNVL